MLLAEVKLLLFELKIKVLFSALDFLVILDSFIVNTKLILHTSNLKLRVSLHLFKFQSVLLLIVLCLLLIPLDPLVISTGLFFGLIELLQLRRPDVGILPCLGNFFLAGKFDLLGFKVGIVSELSLKVMEKSVRRYQNFSNLNCFEPNSPAFELIFKFLLDFISQNIPLAEDFLKCRVCYQIPQN